MLSLRAHYNTKAVIVVAVVQVVVAVGGTTVDIVVVPRAPAQDPKWRVPFLPARFPATPKNETSKNLLAQPPGISMLEVRNPTTNTFFDFLRRHLSNRISLLITTQPSATSPQIV